MAATRRFYPGYALAPTSAIEPGKWLCYLEAGEQALDAFWPHWDYQSLVRVRRQVVIDASLIRSECQLGVNQGLLLVAAWRSSTTQLRGAISSIVPSQIGRQTFDVVAELPSGELGGEVLLRTQVAVTGDAALLSSLAPTIAGSIVWEDEARFRVEGAASRFPVELVDFRGTRLPHDACWVLNWHPDDLHVPFLAAVQLSLNAAHPAIERAMASAQPDNADRAIQSMIKFDVFRQLVVGALGNADFVNAPDSFEDGSTGRELRRLFRVSFGDENIGAIASRCDSARADFEAELQSKARLLSFGPGILT